MKATVLTMVLSLVAPTLHAETAGLQVANIYLPHHEKNARVAIWYPSSDSNTPNLYADNPAFRGVEAQLDGVRKPGKYPIVLFSHGTGGTDRAHAWLGAALAERGAMTVFVNHPNSTWGDFDLSKGVQHWTRAQDLSVVLDHLLADPEMSEFIDMSRVMAAGFSFGGWTALSLGGVSGNHAGAVKTCETRTEMEMCDVLLSEHVRLQDVDPADWNASYSDDRVTQVVAIDPGFVWGHTVSSLENLIDATLVLGLGQGEDRMLATDFDASGFSSLLGERQTVQIAPAYHFSMMPLCKPEGEVILKLENDDPVCTDPEGAERAEIHAKVIKLMAELLGL